LMPLDGVAASFPLLYTLLDVLAAVPKLAEEADAEQVEGMRRLAAALQKSTAAQQAREREHKGRSPTVASTWLQDTSGSSNDEERSNKKYEDACTVLTENLEAAAALLQWALKEAETLGPAERAEALRLPLEIAQALASRITARVLRWIFVTRNDSAEPREGDASQQARARESRRGSGGSARRSPPKSEVA